MANSSDANSESRSLFKGYLIRDSDLKITLRNDVFSKCTTFMVIFIRCAIILLAGNFDERTAVDELALTTVGPARNTVSSFEAISHATADLLNNTSIVTAANGSFLVRETNQFKVCRVQGNGNNSDKDMAISKLWDREIWHKFVA